MFIKIYLYSKNIKSLKNFLFVLNKIKNNNTLNIKLFLNNVKKPKKITKFTVLKSPHVNKTAQEQFEFNFYFRKINLYSFQIFKFLVILKQINCMLFPDVKIKINFYFYNYHLQSKIFKKLNINKFLLNKNLHSNNTIKNKLFTKYYFNLLDFYGEIFFLNEK